MFITYDKKNYIIWGSDLDDKKSVVDALENIQYYNKHGKIYDPDPDIAPDLNTIKCSSELYEIISIDGTYETFPWIIKDGVAEYVEDPLKELRKVCIEVYKRSQFS